MVACCVAVLSACASAPWRGPVRDPAGAPLVTPEAAASAASSFGSDGWRAPPVQPAAVDTASGDEVVQTALAVFGDIGAGMRDSLEVVEPEWDLDVRSYEAHERVAHYVQLFSNSARERFSARLSKGTKYEPMIRAKLRANGMPEDLTYLALIESGYDPHAYSRAAAVGMWQFMSSTARDIGLRVDWWVDERRDPARATDGAIRFLGDLREQFGSFYLAAAAYNGGPGRVSRGLTRFAEELEGVEGEDRFFALAEKDYLRAETRNYVPQLIAAALVAKSPNRYGIVLDSQPLYQYDSVFVVPGTSLAAVAKASGASFPDLRELNPALLRGMAPPDTSIWVRLPVGTAESTRAVLDTLSKVQGAETTKLTRATSAAAFASRHGVTLKQLRWFNPKLRVSSKGLLSAGQSVRVPDRATLSYALEVPDPSIERYGTTTSSSSSSRGVHVVRRGETLGGIARRYGLTTARLQAMNGMRGTKLIAGQTIRVRGSTAASRRSGAKATGGKSASGKSASGKSSAATKTKAKVPNGKASAPGASKIKASTGKAPTSRKPATKKPATRKPATKR